MHILVIAIITPFVSSVNANDVKMLQINQIKKPRNQLVWLDFNWGRLVLCCIKTKQKKGHAALSFGVQTNKKENWVRVR